MKKFILIVLLIIGSNFCFATTVYLRKGGTIEGEVISKDDEKFVLKTADGEEKTIKWRSVKNKSIKEIYPELYEMLKKQALERKKKKKEIKKVEEKVTPIFISVKTDKEKGDFEKLSRKELFKNSEHKTKRLGRTINFYKKEKLVTIKIKIKGLNPRKEYILKTIYTHYLKDCGKKGLLFIPTSTQKNVEVIKKLKGKKYYEIEINTPPYYQFKEKLRTREYRFTDGSGRMRNYGIESKGMDIAIWLDDKLIYEKPNGKLAKYNGVSQLK